MATNLRSGDECVVAARSTGGNIVFTWFRFSHETVMPDDKGIGMRVLFGEQLRSETLRRQEAVKTEPYSVFFNVNGDGDFKQRSVVEPRTVKTVRRS